MLKASGLTLIEGNAAEGFSEYLVTLRAPKPANVKEQVYYTSEAHHISNTTTLILVNVITHTSTARTDGILKVNATVESRFLFGFINLV